MLESTIFLLFTNFAGFILAVAIVCLTFFKWKYQYWKRRNMPFLQPSIPFGNMENPRKTTVHFGVRMARIYKEIKAKNLKHCGIFAMTSPMYYVVDLDYLKNILTKDFQYFSDRGHYYNEKADPISAHLFALGGTKWRNLRTKLTPTFTSGKMKMMFHILVDSGKILEKVIDKKLENKVPLDIKDILGCFTTDIIGSCAFGLDCNCFEDDNSEFRMYGKKIFEQPKGRALIHSILLNFPSVGHFFGLKIIAEDVSSFFTKIVTDAVKYRKENNFVRKDFLQILLDLKSEDTSEEHQYDGKSLTLNEIVAQRFIFFLAGFETSSTTMSFALYELAKNKDIQDKVREEIHEVLARYNGEITYEAINEMKYMGQVIHETLRKYPPASLVTRVCVKDYKIADEDIIVEKGTKVFIPILGIHYDEDIYKDPEVFDPERFSEENKKNRHQYAHIPFGEGPRICIGMRFGIAQTKVGLTSLLKHHQFTVNKRTKEPLRMSKSSFVLTAEGGIWLDCQKI